MWKTEAIKLRDAYKRQLNKDNNHKIKLAIQTQMNWVIAINIF